MYLAMSLDMEAKNYKGMAKWLYLQYEEEREHALRFVKIYAGLRCAASASAD